MLTFKLKQKGAKKETVTRNDHKRKTQNPRDCSVTMLGNEIQLEGEIPKADKEGAILHESSGSCENHQSEVTKLTIQESPKPKETVIINDSKDEKADRREEEIKDVPETNASMNCTAVNNTFSDSSAEIEKETECEPVNQMLSTDVDVPSKLRASLDISSSKLLTPSKRALKIAKLKVRSQARKQNIQKSSQNIQKSSQNIPPNPSHPTRKNSKCNENSLSHPDKKKSFGINTNTTTTTTTNISTKKPLSSQGNTLKSSSSIPRNNSGVPALKNSTNCRANGIANGRGDNGKVAIQKNCTTKESKGLMKEKRVPFKCGTANNLSQSISLNRTKMNSSTLRGNNTMNKTQMLNDKKRCRSPFVKSMMEKLHQFQNEVPSRFKFRPDPQGPWSPPKRTIIKEFRFATDSRSKKRQKLSHGQTVCDISTHQSVRML